jgi:hypothetical protein
MNEAQISAWLEAIGTILSAIGNTPSNVLSASKLNDLNLIGNVLQAVGSGIISEDEDYLDQVGSKVEALGNIVTIQAFFVENQRSSQLLNTQGNLIQALGSGVSLDLDTNQTVNEALNNIGNIVQIIGNAYQAFSIKYPPDSQQAQELNTIGSWIQAVGSVLSALTVDS